MPDFDPPFARDAERRVPSAEERLNGFPCGPAERALFNGLLHLIEGQFKTLGDQAGVGPNGSNDHTLLYRAVAALIAAATGGGDTSQFLLVSQAQARLPIFPEILSADGRINVVSPAAGTVRVPNGVGFLHRGIFPTTTVETDFITDVSKIYHVRWDLVNGYRLLDLASAVYNPSALAETDPSFDSTYDDMLIARVITNSSNIASITNLSNKNSLNDEHSATGTTTPLTSSYNTTFTTNHAINWARKPKIFAVNGHITTSGAGALERPHIISGQSKTRYAVEATVGANWNEGFAAPVNLSGSLSFQMGA